MAIIYTRDIPKAEDIYALYEQLNWNEFLKLTPIELQSAHAGSFICLSAYDENELVGIGRIISDGTINAYLCGIGVLPAYRNKGIGGEIVKSLALKCRDQKLHLQLLCNDELMPYYEKLGFEKFIRGMKFN